MCSALVSPNGFKNDVYFMCSVLVSPHGLKKDVYFMSSLFRLMALRTTYISCVACLFRLTGFKKDVYFMSSALVSPHDKEIFSMSRANWLPGSPIDSCQDELSPSDPIESVCQLFNPPRSC